MLSRFPRRISIGLVSGLVAAASLAAPAPAAAEGTAKPTTAQAVERANQALRSHGDAIRTAPGEQYQVVRTILDSSGGSHVRYNRTYAGLPVRGGDFVVHSAAGGAFAGVSLAQQRPIAISTTTARISPDTALTAARKVFEGAISTTQKPRLLIDATRTAPVLAWESVLTGFAADRQTPSSLHVFTDARTGAVLDSYDTVESINGTGKSIYSGTTTVDTTASGGLYTMVDPSHGNGNTCDMGNSTSTCTNFADADNAWGNGATSDRASAAVDAHYGAATTYDYYNNSYGRAGIFGNGKGVPSRVHYASGYVNAFWDGTQMTYGDGAGNARPLVSLDVAGHEMSHGIAQALAGLGYSGDVGGINEANSDINGTMVEFYANNSSDPGDYLIGEKIDIFGTGKPLRYMHQPSLDGASDNCWTTATPGKDPHYSSGVGNHFFFLLAEGSGATAYGTSPVCGSAGDVAGIGRTKAAAIWYNALDGYMVSTETYAQARGHTLAAAADLYGTCSAEYESVQAAWTAVSVPGSDAPCVVSLSSPVATMTVDGGRPYVFVKGSDGNLWLHWWSGSAWFWSNQGRPVGTTIEAGIGGTAVDGGRPYVFVKGGDGNMWVRWWSGSAWYWSNQGKPSGAGIGASYGVMSLDNAARPYIFVKGSDGNLWVNWWSGSAWYWSNQGRPAGVTLAASIGATAVDGGRPYVFAKGSDGNLWVNWWSGSAWGWSNQGRPGGVTLKSGYGVMSLDNAARPYAFVTGNDGNLWVRWWSGSAWGWSNQGRPSGVNLAASVGAVAVDGGRPYVFAKGSDGNMWVQWWSGSAWYWSNQGKPASTSVGAGYGVIALDNAARPYAFVQGGDGNLWVDWWSGSAWGWSNQGRPIVS